RRFRKFDTGNPSRPRCRDEHENHQNYGERRHIRIIADAIGGTVDETQISTMAVSVMPSRPQPSLALRCGTSARVRSLKDQDASDWWQIGDVGPRHESTRDDSD